MTRTLLLGSVLLWIPACASDPDTSDTPGDCDGCETKPEDAACKDRVFDGSGTGRETDTILTNSDQFARFVLLEGDGCPSRASDVMKKLEETQGCGKEANGTMMVNEKSSHDVLAVDKPDQSLLATARGANRAVVSRQCAAEEEPASKPTKACIGPNIEEFDFLVDACSTAKNTPKCFEEESGAQFFEPECAACLTREDKDCQDKGPDCEGRLHKADLRTAEARCIDRDFAPPDLEGRPAAFTLLMSVFTGLDSLSQGGLEVIAFDESEGVFNFYKESQGRWAFMGNSHDFQEGRGGFCKGCHPSGGLVMKELATPWINWEINGDVPHSTKVIENNPDFFGSEFRLGGEGLEVSIVRPGNRAMNEARVNRLKARFNAAQDAKNVNRASLATDASVVFTADETHELLKPLFCTEQINFETGRFGSTGLFEPDLLEATAAIAMPSDQYAAVIADLEQIRGSGNLTSTDSPNQLVRPTNGDVFDASNEGLYPKMVSAGLLSQEFIQDLHIIDFTRPLFSDPRCELLEFAPAITVADAKASATMATAIEAGFIRRLEAASNRSAAASEFLANLRDVDGSRARAQRVNAFAAECDKRIKANPKAFMTDVVLMAERLRRATVDRLEIIEGFLVADVWPRIPDNKMPSFSRWDEATCKLK